MKRPSRRAAHAPLAPLRQLIRRAAVAPEHRATRNTAHPRSLRAASPVALFGASRPEAFGAASPLVRGGARRAGEAFDSASPLPARRPNSGASPPATVLAHRGSRSRRAGGRYGRARAPPHQQPTPDRQRSAAERPTRPRAARTSARPATSAPATSSRNRIPDQTQHIRNSHAAAARTTTPKRTKPALASSSNPAGLNAKGFELNNAGRYGEAVEPLRASVEGYRNAGKTDDVNFAYALYNLGVALNRSGNHAAAIDVLNERLKYPPLQTVLSELAEARARLCGGEHKPGSPRRAKAHPPRRGLLGAAMMPTDGPQRRGDAPAARQGARMRRSPGRARADARSSARRWHGSGGRPPLWVGSLRRACGSTRPAPARRQPARVRRRAAPTSSAPPMTAAEHEWSQELRKPPTCIARLPPSIQASSRNPRRAPNPCAASAPCRLVPVAER